MPELPVLKVKMMKRQSQNTEFPMMEIFYSIQGEGFHTGRPANFVRFAGCDVGCVWCDVKESWNANDHQTMKVDEILNELKESQSKYMVVTGGEPLMYDLRQFCKEMHSQGLELWLETSGAYPLTGEFDWICVSPKKFKKPLPEVLVNADELKVVIYHPSDFSWAESFLPQINENCKLFLQPEYSRFDKVMPLINEYVKENPHWSISLQTHKIMGVR